MGEGRLGSNFNIISEELPRAKRGLSLKELSLYRNCIHLWLSAYLGLLCWPSIHSFHKDFFRITAIHSFILFSPLMGNHPVPCLECVLSKPSVDVGIKQVDLGGGDWNYRNYRKHSRALLCFLYTILASSRAPDRVHSNSKANHVVHICGRELSKTKLKAIGAHDSGMASVEAGKTWFWVAHFWWLFRTKLIPSAAAPYRVSFLPLGWSKPDLAKSWFYFKFSPSFLGSECQ